MFISKPIAIALAYCALPLLGGSIPLDGSTIAHTFDGIGGLSAGASSRLLIDYPEPQRSEILDALFLPNYALSMQILKVEIGGAQVVEDPSSLSSVLYHIFF